MITLTRLSGTEFVLNSDLIERVESTPDTIITLVDGTKYVVAEAPSEIVRAIRTYRAEIVACATSMFPEPGEAADLSDARVDDGPLTDAPTVHPSGTPETPPLASVSVLPSSAPRTRRRSREA